MSTPIWSPPTQGQPAGVRCKHWPPRKWTAPHLPTQDQQQRQPEDWKADRASMEATSQVPAPSNFSGKSPRGISLLLILSTKTPLTANAKVIKYTKAQGLLNLTHQHIYEWGKNWRKNFLLKAEPQPTKKVFIASRRQSRLKITRKKEEKNKKAKQQRRIVLKSKITKKRVKEDAQ